MNADFRTDLLEGFQRFPKAMPSKYLYDQRGSEIFDAICDTTDYYLTRAELSILADHGREIAAALGEDIDLVDLGSGSSKKTRRLLSVLPSVGLFCPVDISREFLNASADALRREFPSLSIQPVCADFTRLWSLPERRQASRRTVVYFAGSTIGNFHPDEAQALLTRLGHLAGRDGAILLGVDLKKDPALLHRAYNDSQGLTAAFNKNLLVRANRELGARFCLDQFKHYAYYEPTYGRMTLTLVSTARQTVSMGAWNVDLESGEPIITEYSYKYSVTELVRLASLAGCRAQAVWMDTHKRFALFLLDM